MTLGTDHLGRLGLDERLEHHLHAASDHIDVATSTDRVQQLGKSDWVRATVVSSFACTCRYTLRITRWPTYVVDRQLHHLTGRQLWPGRSRWRRRFDRLSHVTREGHPLACRVAVGVCHLYGRQAWEGIGAERRRDVVTFLGLRSRR
jgi:hypothetical protein